MRMYKRSCFLFCFLFLVCALCPVVLSSLAQDEGFYWRDNYAEALHEARRTGKPLFLEFRCEP